MPKRTDIKSILIIGAGPIIIGQACEFDYSGTQACKALREEGYRIILVNSNPATIMTDPDVADATYMEPITPEVVAKIIEKERPDALLPTMGGQTALNCALSLNKMGVLEKFGVEMIGANADTIDKAEDRDRFDKAMKKIGLDERRYGAHSLRIGGATAVLAAGLSPATIRAAGRWSSDIYEIYVRLSARGAAQLGATIGSTSFEDLERGTFASEELELLPAELMKGFSVEKELIAETKANNDFLD